MLSVQTIRHNDRDKSGDQGAKNGNYETPELARRWILVIDAKLVKPEADADSAK